MNAKIFLKKINMRTLWMMTNNINCNGIRFMGRHQRRRVLRLRRTAVADVATLRKAVPCQLCRRRRYHPHVPAAAQIRKRYTPFRWRIF